MKLFKPSKKKAKDHLIHKLLKDIAGLEHKLTVKRLFLIRLISNDVLIEIEDYKGESWYLTANDKELNEWVYEFIKK